MDKKQIQDEPKTVRVSNNNTNTNTKENTMAQTTLTLGAYLVSKQTSLAKQIADKKIAKTMPAEYAVKFAQQCLVLAQEINVDLPMLVEPAKKWVAKAKEDKKINKRDVAAVIEEMLKLRKPAPAPVTVAPKTVVVQPTSTKKTGKLDGTVDFIYNGVTRRISNCWGKDSGNNLNFDLGVVGEDGKCDETITRSVWRGDANKNWLFSKINLVWIANGERKSKAMSKTEGKYVAALLEALRAIDEAAGYLNG